MSAEGDLRRLVVAMVVLGAGCMGSSVLVHRLLPAPAAWRMVVALAVGALADVALLHLRFGHNRHSFTWAEAFLVLGLVLVPGPWLVLLAPPAATVMHLALRRPVRKALYNGSSLAVAVLLARLVYDALVPAGSHPPLGSDRTWLGVLAASAVLGAWTNLTAIVAVTLSQGVRFTRVVSRGASLALLVWAGNTVVAGGLVAVSVVDAAALLGLPFLLSAVYLVYRAYLRASQEAETWQLLQRSSRTLTTLSRADLVQGAIGGAQSLFGAEFVELVVVLEAPGAARVYRWVGDAVQSFTCDPVTAAPSFWPRAASELEGFQVVAGKAPTAQEVELIELSLGSCVAVPLVVAGECAGMLRIGFRGPVRMTGREMRVLQTFANQLATSFSNAELHEQTAALLEQGRAMTESLGEGVVAMDVDGIVTFANLAAGAMAGVAVAELSGRHVHEVLHAGVDPGHRAADCPLALVLATGRTMRLDDLVTTQGGRVAVPVAVTASPIRHGDATTGAVIALRDMTERKALEAQLTYQAFHDPITDVANRALFLDRLSHARDRRGAVNIAVLFVDVDRFKVVNDSLGHRAGDALLRQVAQRLAGCLRPADTLARWEGDQFTILLEDCGEAEAVLAAESLLAAMVRPLPALGREVVLSVSVGVALAPAGSWEPQQIIHRADAAVTEAKARGRDTYAVFRPGMGEERMDRLELETAIRRGIDDGEFQVHYQPIVSTEGGRLVGVEALVRWASPRGLLTPAAFIGQAEESGLILPLGRYVLEESCRQVRQWHDRHPGAPPVQVSVNLSGRQFQDENLAADVARILRISGLAPEHLYLEITESVIMQDVPSTMATLTKLKELGVRLAIDDFGTGYSSLSYLKRFPVDSVKIDRSFIDGLGEHEVDTEIVAAVVRLAGTLGMKTVAEGVETETQLAKLAELGCPLVQGFYFSPAQPGEHIEALIEEQLAANR